MSSSPKNQSDSGEFNVRLSQKMQNLLWVIGILTTLAGPTIYVSRLPTKNDMKEHIASRCVSREEFVRSKGEIKANRILLRRIDKKLDQILKWRLGKK